MDARPTKETDAQFANMGSAPDKSHVRAEFARKLERERDEAREAGAWRPIDTAPKDGSEILLGAHDGSVDVGWWCAVESRGIDDSPGWLTGYGYCVKWPTHWLPLPTPPPQKTAREGGV